MDKTCIYNGINELISALKEKGVKVGIVSNKAHEMAVIVVNKLFGEGVFDAVYGKLEGYPAKPDSALTLRAMEELGAIPKETVFIGDSGMDAKTAINAGCTGIGVLWGFRAKEELITNGAHYTVSQPWEILKILEDN